MRLIVYLDDGRTFEYGVASAEKAREHSHAICQTGYRHAADDYFEHYPAHRILKVKVIGIVETQYPDKVSGT